MVTGATYKARVSGRKHLYCYRQKNGANKFVIRALVDIAYIDEIHKAGGVVVAVRNNLVISELRMVIMGETLVAMYTFSKYFDDGKT